MLRHILLLATSFALTSGCSSTLQWPQLTGPGTAPQQRARAEAFDPYPLPDLGPEVVGGRPREYAAPVDPVTRANQFRTARAAQLGAGAIPVGPPVASPAPTFGAYPNAAPAGTYPVVQPY